jgi:hypothetical protein
MKLAIMQPYLFPYLGYIQLISCVDTFVIYDDVNYIKSGWINRNRILYKDSPMYITLSLSDKSSNKKINEIQITGEDTKNKMVSQIESAYMKAPFYREVMPLLNEIILNPENNLSKYVSSSIKMIARHLQIDTNFICSSQLEKNNMLKGQNKVISIAKLLSAHTYINAIGGKELYSKAVFSKEDINLKFIKMDAIEYSQFNNLPIANLSIIDVLMFNSREQISTYLKCYTLE